MTRKEKAIIFGLTLVSIGFYAGAFVTNWEASLYCLIGAIFAVGGNLLRKEWRHYD